jgi:hypothetical protein
MMRRFSARTVVHVVGVIMFVWIVWGFASTQSIQGPRYSVDSKGEGYEIRQYEGYLVAQVSASGTRADAIKESEKILKAYLEGDNALQESLAHGRPLGVQSGPDSERIALVAPLVSQQRGDTYLISYILPPTYTLVTVPRPNNPQIRILQVAPTTLGVRSWRGSSDEARIRDQEQTLRDLLTRDKRVILSAARTLHYSPAWVLPFMRQHEVAFAVRAE